MLKLFKLFLAYEELPWTVWVIGLISVFWLEGRDVGPDQLHLAVLHDDVTAIDFDPTIADRLHFGAKQYQTRLNGLEDFEVKMGPFVIGVTHIYV